jgi:hypothetical protein
VTRLSGGHQVFCIPWRPSRQGQDGVFSRQVSEGPLQGHAATVDALADSSPLNDDVVSGCVAALPSRRIAPATGSSLRAIERDASLTTRPRLERAVSGWYEDAHNRLSCTARDSHRRSSVGTTVPCATMHDHATRPRPQFGMTGLPLGVASGERPPIAPRRSRECARAR